MLDWKKTEHMDDSVIPPEGIEIPFNLFGLDTPLKRFVGITTAAAGILMAFKPSALFKEDETPRPFVWEDPENGVYVPFWAYAVAAGIWAAVYV